MTWAAQSPVAHLSRAGQAARGGLQVPLPSVAPLQSPWGYSDEVPAISAEHTQLVGTWCHFCGRRSQGGMAGAQCFQLGAGGAPLFLSLWGPGRGHSDPWGVAGGLCCPFPQQCAQNTCAGGERVASKASDSTSRSHGSSAWSGLCEWPSHPRLSLRMWSERFAERVRLLLVLNKHIRFCAGKFARWNHIRAPPVPSVSKI